MLDSPFLALCVYAFTFVKLHFNHFEFKCLLNDCLFSPHSRGYVLCNYGTNEKYRHCPSLNSLCSGGQLFANLVPRDGLIGMGKKPLRPFLSAALVGL